MSNSTQNDEIKQIEKAIDEGFVESEKAIKGMKTPFDKPTQNEVLYTAWNCPHEPLGHFVCEKATQKDIDEHLATHTNDHETHNVCNERLEREGSKATCCDCDPHEGCTLGERVPEASKTIKKDWAIEYIKMRTTNTSTISQEVDYIDTLLADARREVIEKVEKMGKPRFPLPDDPRKITERYERAREYEVWKIGYNKAIEDVLVTLKEEGIEK